MKASKLLIACFLIADVIASVGCGDSTSGPATTATFRPTATVLTTKTNAPAPAPSPPVIASPSPAPSPPVAASPPPAPIVTGYGATIDDWNANHIQDPRFAKNAVYDPTPGLGLDDQHNSKYYVISVEDGRVLNYSMRLPNDISVSVAQAAVMQEFPPDANIIWQKAKTEIPTQACYQMEIKSTVLGNALSDPAIGDSEGLVLVEFYTDTKENAGDISDYDASNVNGAFLTLGSYQSPADAPDC
ncbi:MAG: hypothetical protein ACYCXE_05065 [Thermoleophilia bacterium]